MPIADRPDHELFVGAQINEAKVMEDARAYASRGETVVVHLHSASDSCTTSGHETFNCRFDQINQILADVARVGTWTIPG